MARFEEVDKPTCGQFLYRFEDRNLLDHVRRLTPEPDSEIVSFPQGGVELVKCLIEKETSKGWWVAPVYGGFRGKRHWTALHGKKRYAYPTKEEAWESYRRRKQTQIMILQVQLEQAQCRMELIERKPAEKWNPEE